MRALAGCFPILPCKLLVRSSDPCLSFLQRTPYPQSCPSSSFALSDHTGRRWTPRTYSALNLNMAPYDEKMDATTEEQVQMLEVHEKDQGELLPSPVSATAPRPSASKQQPKLSAAMIIPVWIILSSAVIIYNNYLYNTIQFRFPVFLVTWHLTFAVSTPFLPALYPLSTHGGALDR